MAAAEKGAILVRPDSLVFQCGPGAVVTFDRAGRLYSAFLDGRFYRRGVDGRVVEKFTLPDGRTERRRLDPPRAREIVRRALELARAVPGAEAHPLLEDLEADAARFRAAYDGPIPILPPDVYRALVLQATVGCAYNACRFCHLYRDRPFRIRDPEEFRRHVAAAAEAFGAGMAMRRGIFLGDADALAIETDRLLRLLEIARELPPAREGLYGFGALFGEPERTPSEWRALGEAGFRRAYLGVETGHDPLRRRLRKPGTSADALRFVEQLERAGISVGLIFLLGAGGQALAREHVRDSAALVRRAALSGEDLVYLSPLVTKEGRLADADLRAQERAFREAIGSGPRVAVYDIRAFVY